MFEFQSKREQYTKRIRREMKEKSILGMRKQLMESLENYNSFPLFLQNFVMSIIEKRYSESKPSLQFILSNIEFFQNEELREEAKAIDIISALVILSEKTREELVRYHIFEILCELSRFQDCHQPILPRLHKILIYGQDYSMLNLSCLIVGNMMGSSQEKIRFITGSFVINQGVEAKILAAIHHGKRYPLQHWLNFCTPYRRYLMEKGYNTQTGFFLKMEEMCVKYYLESDQIGQIDQVIIDYLSESVIRQFPEHEENVQFVSKLSKCSKHSKQSLKLLERYAQEESWISDQNMDVSNIFRYIENNTDIPTVSYGIRLLSMIVRNSQNQSLAAYITTQISESNELQYLFKRERQLQGPVVELVKQIFIDLRSEQMKVKLIQLVDTKIMSSKDADIICELVKNIVQGQRCWDRMEMDQIDY